MKLLRVVLFAVFIGMMLYYFFAHYLNRVVRRVDDKERVLLYPVTNHNSTRRGVVSHGSSARNQVQETLVRKPVSMTITNRYEISSNNVVEEVVEYPAVHQIFGTQQFELLAKVHYDSNIELDPFLMDFKDILEEDLDSKNGLLVYSGVYLMHVLKSDLFEKYRTEYEIRSKVRADLEAASQISDPVQREDKIKWLNSMAEVDLKLIRLRIQAEPERTRQLLSDLYGEMPKEVFQRLMSVEPHSGASRLNYP